MGEFQGVITLKEIRQCLPLVSHIMGDKWLTEKRHWARRFISPRLAYYQQLESDLKILKQKVGMQKLASCYRAALRNKKELQKMLFEVHGAALLTSAADCVDLHVFRGDGSKKNFDIRVEIKGKVVNAESKTRKDEFPFKLVSRHAKPKGITSSWGSRETMDPHDAEELGIPQRSRESGADHIATPESTVIRQLMLGALSQLPENGCNILLFGHIEGHQLNVEAALYGTEFVEISKNLKTRKASFMWKRAPTGAFGPGKEGSPFRALTGVLWIRLMRHGSAMVRAYKLYPNPNSQVPLHSDVAEAIKEIITKWTTPKDN